MLIMKKGRRNPRKEIRKTVLSLGGDICRGGREGKGVKREGAQTGFTMKLNIRRWKMKWRLAALKVIQAGDGERQRMTADQFKHEKTERKRIIMLACKLQSDYHFLQ